jgi:hypothetical protein
MVVLRRSPRREKTARAVSNRVNLTDMPFRDKYENDQLVKGCESISKEGRGVCEVVQPEGL